MACRTTELKTEHARLFPCEYVSSQSDVWKHFNSAGNDASQRACVKDSAVCKTFYGRCASAHSQAQETFRIPHGPSIDQTGPVVVISSVRSGTPRTTTDAHVYSSAPYPTCMARLNSMTAASAVGTGPASGVSVAFHRNRSSSPPIATRSNGESATCGVQRTHPCQL